MVAHSIEYSLNKTKMLRKGHLEDAKAFESILIAFSVTFVHVTDYSCELSVRMLTDQIKGI